MANRSRDRGASGGVQSRRARQLRDASDLLAVVLQSVDLDAETQLAENVAEAIRAIDRAHELETEGEDAERESREFVFPVARTEGRVSRDR